MKAFEPLNRIRVAKRLPQRISILNRKLHKAAKLCNSGAMPQALYGFEAFGLSPSSTKKVTAVAHQSVVANGRHGRCDVADIALSLGFKYHPYSCCKLRQLESWFQLLGSTMVDKADMARAFTTIRVTLWMREIMENGPKSTRKWIPKLIKKRV